MKKWVIANFGLWDGLLWVWNFQWLRQLFEWERLECEDLQTLIAGFFECRGS